MAEQNEEGKKTIVSFVVGLLIGGLLVWSFGGSSTSTVEQNDINNTDDEATLDANSDETAEGTNETQTEANDSDNAVETTTTEVATLPTGDGAVDIADTAAGSRIPMASATFPVAEGWVGIRDYNNGQLGPILGVVRFSEEQGLVPTEIILQRPTVRGNEYAVVFYTEDGDLSFNVATDLQIEGIVTTFTAS